MKPTPKANIFKSIGESWTKIGSIASAGAIVLAWFALYPGLSLSIGSTRDPKLPLETHFIIMNDCIYPIYHIHYDCEIWHMHSQSIGNIPRKTRIGLDEIDSISSHGPHSIYCGGYLGEYTQTYPPDAIARTLDDAILNIYVHFRVPLWPWEVTREFGFALRRDTAGSVEWLPADRGLNMPERTEGSNAH